MARPCGLTPVGKHIRTDGQCVLHSSNTTYPDAGVSVVGAVVDGHGRAAEEYFYRCGAESISRGYSETNHEPVKIWADDVSGSLAGKQGEDLLPGIRLVSEASPEELSRALMLARTRMNFLAWTEALLSGSAVPELPFSFPAEPQRVSSTPGTRS